MFSISSLDWVHVTPQTIVIVMSFEQRGEVVTVAKFLDDNKPIKSLKKSIRNFSNFTDLIQFHLIWQILAKFSLEN